MGCCYLYCRIWRYLSSDWNICNIEIPVILISLLKVRHIEMDGRPYCYECLVLLLSTITVNLSRSDKVFIWISYFIISVMWRLSFKTCIVNTYRPISSIYRPGTVISFDIWFDGKTPWWLWKDAYSVLVFVTAASRMSRVLVIFWVERCGSG